MIPVACPGRHQAPIETWEEAVRLNSDGSVLAWCGHFGMPEIVIPDGLPWHTFGTSSYCRSPYEVLPDGLRFHHLPDSFGTRA